MSNKRVKTNTEILANGKLEGLTYKSENVVNLITNKAFKSDLTAYIKAEADGEKVAWKLVRLIGKMSGEIKQDFGSDYAFAEFMGMSQSVVNKRKHLAEFAIELEKEGYTDSKAYEILPLIKKLQVLDSHEKRLEAFRQILQLLSPTMTQKELREAVKNIEIEIKDENPPKIEKKEVKENEEETGEATENTEAEKSAENENTEEAGIDFELDEMIEVDLPVWLDSETRTYTVNTYTVSGEVLIQLLNAIQDVIGKDVE